MPFEINKEFFLLWKRFHKVFIEANTVANNFNRSKEMLRECVEAQRAAKLPELLYQKFEQFLIATASLQHAQAVGELSRMGDWSMWAMTEELKVHFVQTMQIGRFYDFRECPEIYNCPTYEAACVIYFNGLFDYARRRTAIKDVCESVWSDAMLVFLEVMSQPASFIQAPEAMLGCMMLTWSANESPKKAQELTKKIEKLVSNEVLAKHLRVLFCMSLSTDAGKYSSQPPSYWASRALSEFSEHLTSLDRAQMMVTVLWVDENGRSDAEKAISQMAIVRAERTKGKTMLAATRDSSQTVEYIRPYFVRTVAMVAPDLVLGGLQTWYQQRDQINPLDPDSVLFSIPFGEQGATLLCGQNIHILARDSQTALVNISRKMMAFLNTYTTVVGADNSNLAIPDRPGHVLEHMEGLATALHDAYCPDGLEIPGAPQCQLILPTEGHPIQATQFSAWGKTWPIASSLCRPRSDRKPKSVLIWCADVLTGPMETEMVEAAFKRVGAVVKVFSPNESNAIQFMNEYENSNYDVFWVLSHGDFDHWSPHEVKLRLAQDNSSVMLQDLWNRSPTTEQRRLLVLNVCDGARFAEPGMLPRVGLAAGLASPTQATISHLWPVRFLPSAAFGVYLAKFVASGMPYFEAYCATLKALQKSANEIGIELEDLYESEFQLIKSLKASYDNFSEIETWGSAAFYQ